MTKAIVGESGRTRLPAEQRRRQLVAIGLRLLVDEPIHDFSLDTVAAEAGLSRSLLFHHFPTKRDFYLAVVGSAAEHLLAASTVAAGTPPADRLSGLVSAYVSFVAAHRAQYRSLVLHAGGGDPEVSAVFEATRRELAGRLLAAAGLRRSARRELAARAWLAMAEEYVLGGGDGLAGTGDATAALVEAFGWVTTRLAPAVPGLVSPARR